jgi:hypothetical protein
VGTGSVTGLSFHEFPAQITFQIFDMPANFEIARKNGGPKRFDTPTFESKIESACKVKGIESP